MKTLVLDIETSPHITYEWNLWGDRYTPADRLIRASEVMCFAWMWHGQRTVQFEAGLLHPNPAFTQRTLAQRTYDLLDAADAAVTFNGDKFDLPKLNHLLKLQHFTPPSPYKSIDLRKTVRGKTQHAYSSLNFVAQELGLGKKVKHPGFQMWIDCMAGDPLAWAKMERYNKQDVRLTDRLYVDQLPWIQGHPNAQLIDGLTEKACPRCERETLIREGFRHNRTGTYIRYHCTACGGWSQGTHRVDSVRIADAAA